MPFVANNDTVNEIKQRISDLKEEVDKLRQILETNLDDMIVELLIKKLAELNELNDQHEELINTILDTKKICVTLNNTSSDKTKRAMELFERGDIEGANTILNSIISE